MRQKSASHCPDLLVARLAARQHGVVSLEDVLRLGLTPSGITRRIQTGRLHRVYRGVYAVGHTALGNEGRSMAAVLASGERAVLSHRSAAELWGLLPAHAGPVDVTIPTANGRRPRTGIRLHRIPSLPDSVTTRCRGIAVTTPVRTIADLRRAGSVDDVRRAVREAEFKRLDLGRRADEDVDLTRSELERRFLGLCTRRAIPKPEVNVKIGSFEVDFLWRAQRLVVETDGWEAHGTPSSFEADRARDGELKLMGYEVVRFTYRQVTREPRRVAAIVRALLEA